jgi:hypothetical protein
VHPDCDYKQGYRCGHSEADGNLSINWGAFAEASPRLQTQYPSPGGPCGYENQANARNDQGVKQVADYDDCEADEIAS